MCEIIVFPPNLFKRHLNIWGEALECELSRPLASKDVDHTHNGPLIHLPACLYCGKSMPGSKGKRRNGRGKSLNSSKSRNASIFLFLSVPLLLSQLLVGRTVCVLASPLHHWSKQRKLNVAFLPFEYGRLPPLAPRPLACTDILNTPIKFKNATKC